MNKNDTPNEFCSALRLTKETTGEPILQIDYEKYEQLLEEADLTEDEKREFITALWSIIVEFASLGFGVHPFQQIDQSVDCDFKIDGETSRDEIENYLPEELRSMLNSPHPKQQKTTIDAEDETSLAHRESEET